MSTKEPKTVAVRLIKPHRHAGRDYPASTEGRPSVMTLREDKANWLVADGVAELVTTALGATGVNATVGVTYNDGTTSNLTAFALEATPRQGRLYPLITAVSGKFIRGVTGVTLSASTGTVGNFGITATRSRASVSANVANKTETFDWAQLGLPNIPNDSCLFMLMNCTTTTTGVLRGQGKIAHG